MNTEPPGGLVLTLPHTLYSETPLSLPEGVFLPRPELHVTLLGRRQLASLSADHRHQLDQWVRSVPWTVRSTGHALLIRKAEQQMPDRQAVVELCAVAKAVEFYHYLNVLTERQWPIPPLHITAMTDDGKRGIGLYSAADLARFQQRPLDESETQTLLAPARQRVMMLPTQPVGLG